MKKFVFKKGFQKDYTICYITLFNTDFRIDHIAVDFPKISCQARFFHDHYKLNIWHENTREYHDIPVNTIYLGRSSFRIKNPREITFEFWCDSRKLKKLEKKNYFKDFYFLFYAYQGAFEID